MKRYTSRAPELSMTVLVDGKLQRIKFHQGFFETDNVDIQRCIESNIHFGSEIMLLDFDPEKAKAEVKKVMKRMKVDEAAVNKRARKKGIDEDMIEGFMKEKPNA